MALFLKRIPFLRADAPDPFEIMTNAENIGAPAAKAVQKKASTSSFYIAMRLMPAEERDAMFRHLCLLPQSRRYRR
jgi:hypothetical protein